MDQLIDVATWAGLVAAVFGIGLAIVAIWFTFSTDARSRRVSEQMIKSLQKIEGFVERSSSDTQGLIKVGWDRMLGNMANSTPEIPSGTGDSSIRQIAEGLAEEVRTQLDEGKGTSSGSVDEERIIQRVSDAIQAQLKASQRQGTSSLSSQVEGWMRTLSGITSTAYELIFVIARVKAAHLTRSQYEKLVGVSSKYQAAMSELRSDALLIPLTGQAVPRSDQPVYWLPPGQSDAIRAALELGIRDDPAERADVMRTLTSIGYLGQSSNSTPNGDR